MPYGRGRRTRAIEALHGDFIEPFGQTGHVLINFPIPAIPDFGHFRTFVLKVAVSRLGPSVIALCKARVDQQTCHIVSSPTLHHVGHILLKQLFGVCLSSVYFRRSHRTIVIGPVEFVQVILIRSQAYLTVRTVVKSGLQHRNHHVVQFLISSNIHCQGILSGIHHPDSGSPIVICQSGIAGSFFGIGQDFFILRLARRREVRIGSYLFLQISLCTFYRASQFGSQSSFATHIFELHIVYTKPVAIGVFGHKTKRQITAPGIKLQYDLTRCRHVGTTRRTILYAIKFHRMRLSSELLVIFRRIGKEI